ncbi:MAG TPA: sigma-70 family RNA polymerase sigma factor [Planctomycetota bacterium]|nr:sigma-70 family RNA polymerase sigma factor [Planctomycetota bacterium]
MSPLPHDHEELLAEVAWVRAVAASLVRDPHLADDVSQDALVSALRSPASGVHAARRWLAGVARHALLQLRRADARRVEREKRAARPEAQPSAHALVERAAAQRAVVGAVLDLPEPFRATVLLRFFEGLTPAEIAEREGVAVATVYTRLSRAFERLRAQLDREHGGDREAWSAALASWIHSPLAGPTAALGGIVVNAKLALGAAALAAIVGAFFIWPSTAASDAAAPANSGAIAVAQAPSVATASGAPRARVPEANPSMAPHATSEPARAEKLASARPSPRSLRGRVVDLESRGVAGVEVRWMSRTANGESALATVSADGEGRFELDTPSAPGRLVVGSARWTTVLAGRASQVSPVDPLVVVAPRIGLAGSVADETGAAIEGAAVELRLPKAFRSTFRDVLDLSVDQTWTSRTDASGRFEIAEAPAVPDARLVATRAGFATREEPAPQGSAFDLAIVLKRNFAEASAIEGRVVGPADEPISGARISGGGAAATSGDDGRFSLSIDATARAVTAAKAGYQPAIVRAEVEGRWPSPLVLRLRELSKSIAGRVVDPAGKPLPRARVWIRDPTWFASSDEHDLFALEWVLGGRKGSAQVDADDEGRFRIEGLVARPYDLGAIDARTLRRGELDRVEAGATDARVVVPDEPVYARVAGRVVRPNGDPIEGVEIRVFRQGFQIQLATGGWYRDGAAIGPVVTDAEGRFELRDVVRESGGVMAEGDAIVTVFAPFAGEPVDMRVEALARCHLKLEVDPAEHADRFEVRDAKDEKLGIYVWQGESVYRHTSGTIEDGRSPVTAVVETARTVVIFRGADELRRVPVELAPGKPTIVR